MKIYLPDEMEIFEKAMISIAKRREEKKKQMKGTYESKKAEIIKFGNQPSGRKTREKYLELKRKGKLRRIRKSVSVSSERTDEEIKKSVKRYIDFLRKKEVKK